MTASDVRQNTERCRFELDVDGETTFASYAIRDGVMSFLHTETPPPLRGRGIAEQVVLGALAQARAQGFKVRPLCSYVAHVIDRHPEFHDLLA